MTSPVAARLLGGDGKVVTKANLNAYFQRGLEAYPNLRFDLTDVLWGAQFVVLYYTNQNGIPVAVAEFMELSPNEKWPEWWRTTGRAASQKRIAGITDATLPPRR